MAAPHLTADRDSVPAAIRGRERQDDGDDWFVPANATSQCARGTNLSDQVSFIIKHQVKPGKHEEYEAWLHRIIPIAARQRGHMGAQVAKPASGGDTYQISVRFATREDAERWARSDERRQLAAELDDLIQTPETLDIRSGIDYWFTAATENHVSPPRWKQWLLTASAVWLLGVLTSGVLERLFEAAPFLGRFGVEQLVRAIVTVSLLTYVVMPRYTRAVRKWLSRG
jgi:antibiotic biosynthesis monooxygenase (ABM) superfamily enzyme